MEDIINIDEETMKKIAETFRTLKTLVEEKKSISEDIREEKIRCSKETHIPVKSLNTIMKLLADREKGNLKDEYITLIKSIEEIS